MEIDSGERGDRRRWREEGAERVAAVDEGRRCTDTEDNRRAPQQGSEATAAGGGVKGGARVAGVDS